MIGSLHGIVELIDGSKVLVNVNGVGYLVYIPQTLLLNLHKDMQVDVYTYTHVREDLLELYGFASFEDLKLFEKLLEVSGIGPKTAIGVFSLGRRSDILAAIQRADVKFFTGVPRLGTKNAQKLIIELKGKLTTLAEVSPVTNEKDKEVVQALKGFGFKEKEITEALEAIGEGEMESSKKIKLALKYLGK